MIDLLSMIVTITLVVMILVAILIVAIGVVFAAFWIGQMTLDVIEMNKSWREDGN